MKKIALLFTLTLMGAGALNGMEQPKGGPPHVTIKFGTFSKPIPYSDIEKEAFSPEAKAAIISTLETYDKFDDVIKALKDNDALEEVYSNQEEFNGLVHILSKGFDTIPLFIVSNFNNEPAFQYIRLMEDLQKAVRKASNTKEVRELIKKGADVTANPGILIVAMFNNEPTAEITQLLLDHGANPNAKNINGLTALDILHLKHSKSPEYEEIRQLLANAMKKEEYELKEIIIQ